VPHVSKILKDKTELERALRLGNFAIRRDTGDIVPIERALPEGVQALTPGTTVIRSGQLPEGVLEEFIPVTSRNARRDFQRYAMVDIFDNSWDAGTSTFSAKKLREGANRFLDSESGRILFNQETRQGTKQFFKNLTERISKVSPHPNNLTGRVGVSRYMGLAATSAAVGALTVTLSPALGINSVLARGAIIPTIVLGVNQLGRLLTSRTGGRIMNELVNGQLTAPPAVVGRQIARILAGEQVISLDEETGEETPSEINNEGVLVPLQQ
jgi:hypothetical protein